MLTQQNKFRLLDGEKRWERDRGIACRIMVFEPKGLYPAGTLHVPNGIFYADDEIAFSLVKGESWELLDPDAPYSEFRWASPQELRLIAAILLCELREGPYIRLYPIVRYSPLVDTEEVNFSDPAVAQDIKSLLLDSARTTQQGPTQDRISRCIQRAYDTIDVDQYGFDRLGDFWNRLVPLNYVLLRGIYALMKSDMLAHHYEFSEEAIVSLYISLEASFSLVTRQLKQDGNSNPTAHDAARWLHNHFDRPFGLPEPKQTEKYFHEFYEQRIMTLHPASRYGDLPYAPIMHSDIPHLRRSLREIFAYLVIGAHGADYLADVQRNEWRRETFKNA